MIRMYACMYVLFVCVYDAISTDAPVDGVKRKAQYVEGSISCSLTHLVCSFLLICAINDFLFAMVRNRLLLLERLQLVFRFHVCCYRRDCLPLCLIRYTSSCAQGVSLFSESFGCGENKNERNRRRRRRKKRREVPRHKRQQERVSCRIRGERT